jgi:hypothetical protein
MSLTTCIGCGCTELNACLGGCTWLVVFEGHEEGICSECPDTYQLYLDNLEDVDTPALILPDDPEFNATLAARRHL